MKQIVAGLVALMISAIGAPAYAACPAAGSIVITAPDGIVGQVWIRAGAFSVSPMINGTSIWFATQNGAAETILILINRTDGPLTPHIKVADLDGTSLAEGDLEVTAGRTFTLSVAEIVAPLCP